MESGLQSHGDIVVVFIKLMKYVDVSDVERSVSLLLDKDKAEVLFTCVNFLSIEHESLDLKERLTIIMFIDSI